MLKKQFFLLLLFCTAKACSIATIKVADNYDVRDFLIWIAVCMKKKAQHISSVLFKYTHNKNSRHIGSTMYLVSRN